MLLKSYSEFFQNRLFEDSMADWAKGNEEFDKLYQTNFNPKVQNTIRFYNGVNIGWFNTKNHNIIKRVGRTLIDSQVDFEDQIHNLVDFILTSNYDFIPKLKYDFWVKSKNCHFIFTYNMGVKDLYIMTIVPQKGTGCVDHFEID